MTQRSTDAPRTTHPTTASRDTGPEPSATCVWGPCSSLCQEIPPGIWRNTKVHYRACHRLPLVPILRQMNSVHTHSSHLSSILILSSMPRSSKRFLSFRFSTWFYSPNIRRGERLLGPNALLHRVKQSLHGRGQALRVPEGWGSHLSKQSAHEGGKDVSPTHRPPLLPRKYSWY